MSWQIIFQSVGGALATAFSAVLTIYAIKAVDAFQKWTGEQFSAQQRSDILGAVTTAAGVLQTQLDQGIVTLSNMHHNDPAVQHQAQLALNAEPAAMDFHHETVDSVARQIVGRVDTTPRVIVAPIIPMKVATP